MKVTWKLVSDPLWINFVCDENISKKEVTYKNQNEAMISPLASKIFGFPWVEEVIVYTDKVSVKRQDWVDWDVIADPLSELIDEHLSSQSTPIEENPEPVIKVAAPELPTDLSPEANEVVKFLEEEVNPQVAAHGGRINFVKLDEGRVFLSMEGGCQGCGMAQQTLRDGVETSLKETFSFVKEIIDTTDHSSGLRPFIK